MSSSRFGSCVFIPACLLALRAAAQEPPAEPPAEPAAPVAPPAEPAAPVPVAPPAPPAEPAPTVPKTAAAVTLGAAEKGPASQGGVDVGTGGWHMSYHGFFRAPMRVGIGTRTPLQRLPPQIPPQSRTTTPG